MMRSVDKSKLTGFDSMIVIIDFSLKPALTSLTIETFVRASLSVRDCPHAGGQIISRPRIRRRLWLNRKRFMMVSSSVRDDVVLQQPAPNHSEPLDCGSGC